MAPSSVTQNPMVGEVPRFHFEAARKACFARGDLPFADSFENFRYHLVKTFAGPTAPDSGPPEWIGQVAQVVKTVIPDAHLVVVGDPQLHMCYIMFFSDTVVGTFVGSEFH